MNTTKHESHGAVAVQVERGVRPHATDGAAPLWFDDGGRAWWVADELTGDRLAAWVDAKVAAERERCCRIVAVQRDDDRYDVARRTILAIRAGDDFFYVDDDVLRA
jgi:hypothetical protein